jgi:hypothetical protein
MSIAPKIRSAADALVARLTDDLRQHVDGVVQELADAAEAADAAREAERDARDAEAERRQAEALAALRAELTTAQEEAAREARDALQTAQAEASEARVALEAARAESAAMRTEADAALAQAESAVAEAVAQAAAQQDAHPHDAVALGAVPGVSADEAATRLSAVARAISAMDEATTLSEVLDALASGLVSQVTRSAVLVFKGEQARVWRRSGFDGESSEVGAPLMLDDHADLKALVESATPAYLEGRGEDALLLGVATLPQGGSALAVPVAIGGQVAALVYADAGTEADTPSFPGWGDLVEVLARHAARCLEALTAMRASGYARPQRPAVVVPMPPHLRVVQRPALDAPVGDAIAQAQRVARLLVSEIRLNREEDIRLGREAGDLGERLDEDIERARQQYQSRVAEGVPGRDALFEDELIRTLANGNAELLRRQTGS